MTKACTVCGADLHRGRCHAVVGGVIQPNVIRLRRHFSVPTAQEMQGIAQSVSAALEPAPFAWTSEGIAYTLQEAPDSITPRPDNG